MELDARCGVYTSEANSTMVWVWGTFFLFYFFYPSSSFSFNLVFNNRIQLNALPPSLMSIL